VSYDGPDCRIKPTAAQVYAKCNEIGECMVWSGNCNNHVPNFYLGQGPGSGKNKLGTYFSCRRIVYEEMSGLVIPPKMYPVAMCRDKMCVRYEHIKLLTRKQIGMLLAKEGKYSSPQRRAAIAAGIRKSGKAKLTIELAREIRASSETGKAIAKRLGVDKSLPPRIRRNQAWLETASGASVFNLVGG
jgi:hypothetical protein